VESDYEAGWRLVLQASKGWDETDSPDAYLRIVAIIEPLALTGDAYALGIWDACRSLSGASVG
jgi:hypothetical protein